MGSLPHFASHCLPIYQSLPDHIRGPLYAKGRAYNYLEGKGVRGMAAGVPRNAELVMCASFEDYRAVAPSPVILVNHGIGQKYGGDPKSADHSSYSGGKDRDRVALNICPSERDAQVCREHEQRAVAAGTPKLDWAHNTEFVRSDPPTVAFSFHADVFVCPETRWSLPHYKDAIIDLARNPDRGFNIIGHAHPRMHAYMVNFWRKLRVEYVPDFDDVLARADLFVNDNSSTLYEFASTGRPVVVLDAPWYRKDIHHRGRFWDWADVGVRVGEPGDLESALHLALTDPPTIRTTRESIVSAVYAGPDGECLADGRATERAVNAIMRFLDAS